MPTRLRWEPGVASDIPVYLALDYPESRIRPRRIERLAVLRGHDERSAGQFHHRLHAKGPS